MVSDAKFVFAVTHCISTDTAVQKISKFSTSRKEALIAQGLVGL